MFFGCILDEDCRTTFVSEFYSQDPAELQNVWIIATVKQQPKIIKIGSRLKFSEIESVTDPVEPRLFYKQLCDSFII